MVLRGPFHGTTDRVKSFMVVLQRSTLLTDRKAGSRNVSHVSNTAMANSLVVHGAIFAVGALVGGGIATTIARKNETASLQNITRPQQPVLPIIQVGTTGNAVITPNVGVVSPPLKYGNPGV